MNKSHILIAAILIAVMLTAVPFCYKAIYCPVKTVTGLHEYDVRGGDFWGSFPASFVKAYNPYLLDRTYAWVQFGNDWVYGPVEYLITLPLTFIKSIKLVSIIWLLMNYIFMALSFLMILRMLKGSPYWVIAFVVILWMGFWPLYAAIQEDVIEIFQLFAITLSLYMLHRKRESASGIAMGIACMAKFLPMIFIIYFLFKRKFKALLAMVLTVIFIAVLTQFTLGWQNSLLVKLFTKEAFSTTHEYTYWRSQTISSAVERLFSRTDYSLQQITRPILVYPYAANLITNILRIFMAVFSIFFISRWRLRTDYLADYAIMLLFMILVSPHGHPHYLIFALPAFSVMVRNVCISRNAFIAILLFISYFLSGYLVQLKFLESIFLNNTGINIQMFIYFLSFPAYGAMILYMILAYSENKIMKFDPAI